MDELLHSAWETESPQKWQSLMPVVEQLQRSRISHFARTSSHNPEVRKWAGSAPASSPPHPLSRVAHWLWVGGGDALPHGKTLWPKSPGTVMGKLKDEERFPGGSVAENPPAMPETQDWSLSQEDLLQKEMATCILAWEIPWSEEPGGLQSMRLRKSWTQLSV